jgi:kojibiose phosphorylase
MSGDRAPTDAAAQALDAAQALGVEQLAKRHRAAWRSHWREADVAIEGDLELQRAMRFGLYHLISSADPESDVASVGARGLSGPGYRGHVFWDTEVFILPFFACTQPETARALLAYRYRTLGAARARAAKLGYRGALFAWESADTGEDVTPSEAVGPDEYHEGIDDNAFTNVLARWNIERALELRPILEGIDPAAWTELEGRLGITDAELDAWRAVAATLVDGFDAKTGLYEQFSGFFGLEDIRAVDVAPRPFAGDVALGAARVQGAQVVKQADVLMLAHMLPELLPPAVIAANYAYYEPRTSHGSSLSPAIHAAVAARAGRLDDTVSYAKMAAAIDLGNGMGNAAHGVHVATMGGLWQAGVMGCGGLRVARATVHLDPVIPDAWKSLRFPLRCHGRRLQISFTADELTLDVDGDLELGLGANEQQSLHAGRYRSTRAHGAWSSLEVVR